MTKQNDSEPKTATPLEDFGNFADEEHPNETRESAHQSSDEETTDLMSDPAQDDSVGSDWTGEGGATLDGPATAIHESDA